MRNKIVLLVLCSMLATSSGFAEECSSLFKSISGHQVLILLQKMTLIAEKIGLNFDPSKIITPAERDQLKITTDDVFLVKIDSKNQINTFLKSFDLTYDSPPSAQLVDAFTKLFEDTTAELEKILKAVDEAIKVNAYFESRPLPRNRVELATATLVGDKLIGKRLSAELAHNVAKVILDLSAIERIRAETKAGHEVSNYRFIGSANDLVSHNVVSEGDRKTSYENVLAWVNDEPEVSLSIFARWRSRVSSDDANNSSRYLKRVDQVEKRIRSEFGRMIHELAPKLNLGKD